MSNAIATTVINLPRQAAWEKLQDLRLAHHYVPGIVDTKITTEITQGIGTSRNVYRKNGQYLQETVTDWREGAGFSIRLHNGEKDSPFKNASFHYALADTADGNTLLTTTMSYTPPLGPIGKTLDKLFLNRIISGVITDVALSMKYFYETGETATKSRLKTLKRAAR